MNKSAQILLYRIILGCPLLLVAPEHALAAPSDPDWKEFTATPCRAHIVLIELRGNGVVAGRTGPHEPSSTWHKSPLTHPLASQTFDRDVTKLQARPCSTAAIEAAVSPHRL